MKEKCKDFLEKLRERITPLFERIRAAFNHLDNIFII